jgi:hypothetical protein
MYNDRHWLTDVAAGAGIGILCTKTAYWLYPKMQKLLFKKETKTSVMIAPFYNGKEAGIGLAGRFLCFMINFHQFGFYDTTK